MKTSFLAVQSSLALAALLPFAVANQVDSVPVAIETTFEFGFFPGASIDNGVAQEEINGMSSRASAWFMEELLPTYPELESFLFTEVGHSFDPEAENPLTIEVDISATFHDGSMVPTPSDLFKHIESLDFQEFIQEAVWTADMTGGSFDDVQFVAFMSRVNPAIGNTQDETESNEAETPSTEDEANNNQDDTDTSPTAECATTLKQYRESDGQESVQVSLECLSSPLCTGKSPSVAVAKSANAAAEGKGAAVGDITCDFTAHTSQSHWSDCNTTHSESFADLGVLLAFSQQQWMTGEPLVGNLTPSHSHLSWGISRGCGDDDHVYLLFRNAKQGSEESVYDVVGYQSLDAFEDPNQSMLDGVGFSSGVSISTIEREAACPQGSMDSTDVLATCQINKAGEDQEATTSGGVQLVAAASIFLSVVFPVLLMW